MIKPAYSPGQGTLAPTRPDITQVITVRVRRSLGEMYDNLDSLE